MPILVPFLSAELKRLIVALSAHVDCKAVNLAAYGILYRNIFFQSGKPGVHKLLPCHEKLFQPVSRKPYAASSRIVFEVLRSNSTHIADAQNEAIDNGMAKLLHKIKRKARSPRPNGMHKSDIWVEAARLQETGQRIRDQDIAEGQKRVGRVGRWAARPARERNIAVETGLKPAEIPSGGISFKAK